jgi:hypothetical protein
MNSDWVPTARLRWVAREVVVGGQPSADSISDSYPATSAAMNRFQRVLEQWWTADLPSYMRRANEEGEWREVVTVEDAP